MLIFSNHQFQVKPNNATPQSLAPTPPRIVLTLPRMPTPVTDTSNPVQHSTVNSSPSSPCGLMLGSESDNPAPVEQSDSQPFSDWGDTDCQDLLNLEDTPEITPAPKEDPRELISPPSKRRISETEDNKPVTDSSLSPLKKIFAKLNF